MANTAGEVWRYAQEMVDAVVSWVESTDGKVLPLRFAKADQLRLLTLRTWALRYRVPVQEILDLVVPILRGCIKGRAGRKERTKGTLGLRIPMLVGAGAERILQEEICKHYPGAEHIAAWRAQEQERQLQKEQEIATEGIAVRKSKNLPVLQYEDVDAFVSAYRAKALRNREEFRSQVGSKKRKRKPYRWNPWR